MHERAKNRLPKEVRQHIGPGNHKTLLRQESKYSQGTYFKIACHSL